MNNEIKLAAIAVFENYPNAKEVFITPDEQAFLKEDRARMHNKDFTKVKRSEVMQEEKETEAAAAGKPVKKLAEELIAFVATCELIEELDAILESGEKRATVVAAIAARKVELTHKED
jgi:hypothetical protein